MSGNQYSGQPVYETEEERQQRLMEEQLAREAPPEAPPAPVAPPVDPKQALNAPVAPPVDPKQALNAYLKKMMASNQVEDQGLAAAQNRAAMGNAGLGYAQAGETIGRALAGAAPAQGSFDTYRQANQQRLNDYLTQVKANKEANAQGLDAAKLQVAMEKPAGEVKEYPNIEKGADGKLHKIINRLGADGKVTQKVDLGIATVEELDQANKARELNVKEGGLKVRESQLDLGLRRQGWNENMTDIKRANAVGKYLVDAGEPEFEAVKPRVVAVLTGSKDIPGYGRIESTIPNWLASKESQKFKADVQALIAPVRKGLYGSALTGTELNSFEQMTSTGKGYDEQVFRHALENLIAAKDASINSIKARDPVAWGIYDSQRKNMFVRAPASGSIPAATSTPGKKLRKYNPATGLTE